MTTKEIIKEIKAFSGVVAVMSLLVAFVSCYIAFTPGLHPFAMDVTVWSVVSLAVSSLVWAILHGLTADMSGGTLGGGGLPWRL